MTMSVGYKPYVKSAVSTTEMCGKEHAELTEANSKMASMTVNPGSGNTRNAEIRYKICNGMVNPSENNDALRTYPKAAINKTGLDEQSEDPLDPHGYAPFAQVFPY